MNLNENPALPAIPCAGYFWVVAGSSTFIQIVLIDCPCVSGTSLDVVMNTESQ